MPNDEELAARIRRVLRRQADITERKILGALCGFVYVAPPGMATDDSLREWIRKT